MIGNDIVDLRLAKTESNWRRDGFLQKIFTEREQQLITDSFNSETTVWQLWSRKEAAYKVYNRITKNRAFMPLRLECFQKSASENEIFGTVNCDGIHFVTKTIIHTDYVHTIAALTEKDIEEIQVSFTNPYIENATFYLQKDNNGVPFERCRITNATFPISISHHGKFCSYISTLKK